MRDGDQPQGQQGQIEDGQEGQAQGVNLHVTVATIETQMEDVLLETEQRCVTRLQPISYLHLYIQQHLRLSRFYSARY